jgi:hypothetical protein
MRLLAVLCAGLVALLSSGEANAVPLQAAPAVAAQKAVPPVEKTRGARFYFGYGYPGYYPSYYWPGPYYYSPYYARPRIYYYPRYYDRPRLVRHPRLFYRPWSGYRSWYRW